LPFDLSLIFLNIHFISNIIIFIVSLYTIEAELPFLGLSLSYLYKYKEYIRNRPKEKDLRGKEISGLRK
jgi:hypothetical protein